MNKLTTVFDDVAVCVTEMKDSKTYLPQALAQTHMCTSCKECCGIKDNVGASQSSGAICVMNIILLVVAAVCNFLVL